VLVQCVPPCCSGGRLLRGRDQDQHQNCTLLPVLAQEQRLWRHTQRLPVVRLRYKVRLKHANDEEPDLFKNFDIKLTSSQGITRLPDTAFLHSHRRVSSCVSTAGCVKMDASKVILLIYRRRSLRTILGFFPPAGFQSGVHCPDVECPLRHSGSSSSSTRRPK
jgi:hypothetical protein